MLDLVEEPFDQVSTLGRGGTEADGPLAVLLRGNIGPGALLVDERPDSVGIVATLESHSCRHHQHQKAFSGIPTNRTYHRHGLNDAKILAVYRISNLCMGIKHLLQVRRRAIREAKVTRYTDRAITSQPADLEEVPDTHALVRDPIHNQDLRVG